MLPEQGHLVRVYVGEADKYDGIPLYEWIVRQAKVGGLSGATVLRGIQGFGAHHQIHTAKILDISANLPVVIEIVDSLEKVEAFLASIDAAIGEGMVTIEEVQIRLYRTKK